MKPGRTTISASISMIVLMCAPFSASAAETRTVADQIAELENQYSQTFVTGDVATADRLLADNFIGFGSNGKATTKSGMLAEVRSLPHQSAARITAIDVRSHGDTAIAQGTEDDTSADGKDVAHRMWLDTWKLTPSGWKMVASGEITAGRQP